MSVELIASSGGIDLDAPISDSAREALGDLVGAGHGDAVRPASAVASRLIEIGYPPIVAIRAAASVFSLIVVVTPERTWRPRMVGRGRGRRW